jgi:hypothetical protein
MPSAALAQTAADSWGTIALAALGSSALGAIVGGLLTTWFRGRFEREEAWRTRLIDAADSLSAAMANTLLLGGELLWDYEQEAAALRDAKGNLTESGRERAREVRHSNNAARVLLTRVQLLYGGGSPAYQAAWGTLGNVKDCLAVLEKEPRAVKELEDVSVASLSEKAKELFSSAAKCQSAFAREANLAIKRAQKPPRRKSARPAEPIAPPAARSGEPS